MVGIFFGLFVSLLPSISMYSCEMAASFRFRSQMRFQEEDFPSGTWSYVALTSWVTQDCSLFPALSENDHRNQGGTIILG